MTVTYRNTGAWGAGKGSRLTSVEVDNNFWDHEQRLDAHDTAIEAVENTVIEEFEVVGDQFFVNMQGGGQLGPYQLPTLAFNWREDGDPPGTWAPATEYVKNDVFQYGGSTYYVNFSHTSEATFDPGENNGAGTDYYKLLLQPAGSVIPTGGDTGDVLIKDAPADYMFTWHDPADLGFTTPEEVDTQIDAKTLGKQTIWIPASAMKAPSSQGATPGSFETSEFIVMDTMDFGSTVNEYAQFTVAFPKGWNLGTVTFIPYWSHEATTVNFKVYWNLAGVSISNGELLDASWGSAGNSFDEKTTTNAMFAGPESTALTIGGTPSVGDVCFFRVGRGPGHADDTLAVNARLHGIQLMYIVEAAIDD